MRLWLQRLRRYPVTMNKQRLIIELESRIDFWHVVKALISYRYGTASTGHITLRASLMEDGMPGVRIVESHS